MTTPKVLTRAAPAVPPNSQGRGWGGSQERGWGQERWLGQRPRVLAGRTVGRGGHCPVEQGAGGNGGVEPLAAPRNLGLQPGQIGDPPHSAAGSGAAAPIQAPDPCSGRASAASRASGASPGPADLQVGDVPVDGHGGRHAVLSHVLVVAGARLVVHGVDARDGGSLVAPGDVSAPENGRQLSWRLAPPLPSPRPGGGWGPRPYGSRAASALAPRAPAGPALHAALRTCSSSSPPGRACRGPRRAAPGSPAGRSTPAS